MTTKNIVELNRRSAITEIQGFACGPFGTTTIDAEIKIMDNSKKLYISVQWVDTCAEELLFRVTKNSLFEYYTDPTFTKEADEYAEAVLSEEIECDIQATYPAQYATLIEMVNEKLPQVYTSPFHFNENGCYVEPQDKSASARAIIHNLTCDGSFNTFIDLMDAIGYKVVVRADNGNDEIVLHHRDMGSPTGSTSY